MESPLWHAVGTISAIAFVAAILLSFVARAWFRSTDPQTVKRGAWIISALGGAINARDAQAEMLRRNIV